MGTLVLEGRAKSIVWIPEYRIINRKEVRSRIRGLIISNIEILDERVHGFRV
ncbi:MAG: hypothetical protein WB815_00390 [Nitrososphaeraceae archaeon]